MDDIDLPPSEKTRYYFLIAEWYAQRATQAQLTELDKFSKIIDDLIGPIPIKPTLNRCKSCHKKNSHTTAQCNISRRHYMLDKQHAKKTTPIVSSGD